MTNVFFCWVNGNNTVFDPMSYAAEDLKVISAECSGRESDFPVLNLDVENPGISLLGSGRMVYMWFSWRNPATGLVEPLFFGRLVGLPKKRKGNSKIISLQFVARDMDYLMLRQAAAEGLKTPGNYDAIFIDPAKRDDPTNCLEGYSAVFHYDRLPTGSPARLNVSVSDYLTPEDSTITLTESDVIGDSFELDIGQQPATLIKMRASVRWTQQGAGAFELVNKSGNCWTGGSLVNGWPKPGTKFAGGYEVSASWAFGGGAQYGSPVSHKFSYQNSEQNHMDGDVMSESADWTTYPCGGNAYQYNLVKQAGLLDPWGSATLGGPQGINIPLHVSYSETLVCNWNVALYMALSYNALRPRTETLEFQLITDTQAILSDPNELASLDTETISLTGCDVGAPLITPLSWYSLTAGGGWTGGNIPVGTYVASTANFPGSTLYAIAITSTGGVNANSEPTWSDIIGAQITDGGVTWAMIGPSLPADYPAWQSVANSTVQVGAVIKAMTYMPSPVDRVGVPLPASPYCVQSFQICAQGGVTQQYSNALGSGLADLYPQHPEPYFSATPGVTTTDGGVILKSLGTGGGAIEIPLGLNTGARSFFPSDRGDAAIKYCINYARARQIIRSRIAEASFDCRFEIATKLTCRMGVLVYHHAIPGGNMLGKVIAYSFSINKHGPGILRGSITIAAAVGNGNSITLGSGTGVYVDGVFDSGVAQANIGEILAASPDVSYSRPIDAPNDDGIVFPITDASQVAIKNIFYTGTPPGAAQTMGDTTFLLENTINLVTNPLGGVQQEVFLEYIDIPNGYTPVEIPVNMYVSPTYSGAPTRYTEKEVKFYPVTQYYGELKPLQGMNFSSEYFIATSKLMIKKMIDLGGIST